jgi:GT2 family glycosyltransferase
VSSRYLCARASLRISFDGGGTDVLPFPETESGRALCAHRPLRPRIAKASERSASENRNRSASEGTTELAIAQEACFDGQLELVRLSQLRGTMATVEPAPARPMPSSDAQSASHGLAVGTPANDAAARTYDYEVVLVTYHSRPLVEVLLGTLPTELPIVIVDNAHGVDGLPEVAAQRPATRYLDGPGKGFSAGVNRAMLTSSYDTLILVNPDSSPSLNQLDSLAGELQGDPELVAVSALTASPDGRIELGVGGWEPSVRRALVHAVGAHKLFPTAGLWARPVPGRPIELDWLCGTCMAVCKQLVGNLGGFDERYFVYSEDVQLGRSIREAGLRQKVRTDLVVPHLGAGSTEEPRTRMLQVRGASMAQYIRRHNSIGTINGIRLALTAGYVGRFVARHMLGRHAQAQEHMAYIRGLWCGPPNDLTLASRNRAST